MINLRQFFTNLFSHDFERFTKCKRQSLKNIAGGSFLHHHTIVIQPLTVTICTCSVQVFQNIVDLSIPNIIILWNTNKKKLYTYLYNIEFRWLKPTAIIYEKILIITRNSLPATRGLPFEWTLKRRIGIILIFYHFLKNLQFLFNPLLGTL